MSCLSDKIFLNGYCDNATPTLGQLDVSPYVNLDVLGAIANNTNVSPKLVHKDIVRGLEGIIYGAFFAALNKNGFAPNYATGLSIYNTGSFFSTAMVPTIGQSGVILTRTVQRHNSLKRLKIAQVHLWFAQAYTNVTVNISSGGVVTQYLMPSVAVGENILILPTPYSTNNSTVKVYIDGAYQMQTVKTMLPSCSPCQQGQYPCATFSGMINGVNSGEIMYGISVRHSCGCDYDFLFCEIVNSGVLDRYILLEYEQLYWLKVKNSSRANINSSYTAEAIEYNRNRVAAAITEEQKILIDNILPIIKKYNDHECIICNGVQVKPLV